MVNKHPYEMKHKSHFEKSQKDIVNGSKLLFLPGLIASFLLLAYSACSRSKLPIECWYPFDVFSKYG